MVNAAFLMLLLQIPLPNALLLLLHSKFLSKLRHEQITGENRPISIICNSTSPAIRCRAHYTMEYKLVQRVFIDGDFRIAERSEVLDDLNGSTTVCNKQQNFSIIHAETWARQAREPSPCKKSKNCTNVPKKVNYALSASAKAALTRRPYSTSRLE